MTIAAHIHFFDTGESFFLESMRRLAEQQPAHHFVLFSESELGAMLPANCTVVIISPGLRNRLLLHYWYNYKLPGLLKRYAADIFLTENGVLSLRTIVPQAMLLSRSYEELVAPEQAGFGKYRKKYFSSFVAKAQKIFVAYPYIGSSLHQNYPAFSNMIDLPQGVSGFFRPYEYEEKQKVLRQFTGGNEYFICIVPALAQVHARTVLKAFSIFKKWQKSSMQLVLLAPGTTDTETLVNNFSLYKYKDEVKIISEEQEEIWAALIAAAYACVLLPARNHVEVAGLYPLKCGVPLITAANEYAKAVYGDAVSYTAFEASSISQHMIELYRNENLRQNLQEKGLALTHKNNWETRCKLFWDSIIA